MNDTASSNRRWIIWSFRIAVLVIVGLGVRGTVVSGWERLSRVEWHVQPAWLVCSGALYAAGLVPMAWFWWRALAALNQPAPLSATLRAYFLGHLGKYVPGKAMALILRVAAVGKWVKPLRVAIVSSLLETLTMMAIGGFLAAVLSVFVLRLEASLAAVASLVALACLVPTLPPFARWLARLGAMRVKQPVGTDAPTGSHPSSNAATQFKGIDLQLLACGWAAACLCWLLLGLSLGATLRGIGVDELNPWSQLPLLVAAVSFAVVGGFASMLPGGLGVRDLLLLQLLSPHFGEANALVAAVLVRLVWLVSELIVCGILYIGAKYRSLKQRAARS